VTVVTRKFVPLYALLCAPLAPLLAHAECKRAVLDLPVTISGTRPIIGAKINNKDVRFLVDSGAFFSMMSSAAAQELQLKIGMAPFGLTVSGVGGNTAPGLAVAKVFTLANIDIPNVEFLVGGSEGGSGSIGILGQNFLEKWNVEYDLAKGMIRLFRDTDCSGKFLAYWVAKEQLPYTVTNIDKVTPRTPHTIAHAYINGEKIRVLFDSGAYASMLSLNAAGRAGIKVDSPGVADGGMSQGIGRRLVKSYIAPFSSFRFADGEEIKNARLRIADVDLGMADMLIGGDFFLSHRIFVANSQDKLYFSYNGGPVFDLRKMDANTTAALSSDSSADALADTTTPGSSPPEDAKPEVKSAEDPAALARRATASAGRHDYDSALADLNRATELEPDNAEYFYERGRVLWFKKEQPKAMADFDRAIELKPDYVPALMDRAELRLNARNVPEAAADLEAIDKIAAKQSDVRYEMGFAYERADLLAPAIAQFDLWIAAHGDDSRRAYAFAGRCRARGILGQDLAAALKDCTEAVNLSDKKKSALLLDNRALVRLRLGDYDKAISDYDASLKLEPNKAWTLYGRGLAKLKKNQRAAGEADIAEAVKIAPKVAGGYTEMGLAP
jgi:tetratricopeptide (TPR) repeat protein/predicted aspartyl protease